jgi:hypothetical protein
MMLHPKAIAYDGSVATSCMIWRAEASTEDIAELALAVPSIGITNLQALTAMSTELINDGGA